MEEGEVKAQAKKGQRIVECESSSEEQHRDRTTELPVQAKQLHANLSSLSSLTKRNSKFYSKFFLQTGYTKTDSGDRFRATIRHLKN